MEENLPVTLLTISHIQLRLNRFLKVRIDHSCPKKTSAIIILHESPFILYKELSEWRSAASA
jgi:hypothetical protein